MNLVSLSKDINVSSVCLGAMNFGTTTSREDAFRVLDAYIDAGVPFALHVFEKGEHGLSLANQMVYSTERFEGKVFSKDFAKWVDLSVTWLEERGFKVID